MSETFPSFKVAQKDYTRKNGTRCIFIRLTINRKSKYFSLNLYVDPDHFRSVAVSRSDPDYKDKLELNTIRANSQLVKLKGFRKEILFNEHLIRNGFKVDGDSLWCNQ